MRDEIVGFYETIIAALVQNLGGEARITQAQLENPINIEKDEDPTTGDWIYRADEPAPGTEIAVDPLVGLAQSLKALREQVEKIDVIHITVAHAEIVGGHAEVKLAFAYEHEGRVLATELPGQWLTQGDTVRLHLPLEVTLD